MKPQTSDSNLANRYPDMETAAVEMSFPSVGGQGRTNSKLADVKLPMRKILHDVRTFEKWKGALIFLSFMVVYTCRCNTRLDWEFASETFRFVENAMGDLEGVEAGKNWYCDKDEGPDNGGTFYSWDAITNKKCRLDYADVGEVNELLNYMATSLLALPDQIDGLCSECAIAMTGASSSLRKLVPADFICTDFDPGEEGDGAGPRRQGCIGDDVSALPADLEWAASPNSTTAPCCRNTSLVFASLYLTSLSELEKQTGGDGIVESISLSELEGHYNTFKSGKKVSVITDFILRNIHGDNSFLQLVVSRGQRVLGKNYGAYLTDTGCKDNNYIQNRKTEMSAGRTYSAERLLASCWAEELVTPTLRMWSYRYDGEGDGLGSLLATFVYLLMVFDILHTFFTMYSLAPIDMVANNHASIWRAIAVRCATPTFLLLELPSWIFPIVCDALELRMAMPDWCILLGASQLLIFLRAFAEAEAFETVERLVNAISSAAGPIYGLCVVILASCLAFTSVYGQLFGVFHFEDGGLGTFPDLWLEIIHGFIAGADVIEELFKFNPIGVVLMYLAMNLFLFLIMSQVFIAILLGAYDAASSKDANRTRDLLLPPHFQSLTCVRRSGWRTFNLRFPIYLLTWYDIECETWGPLLLYALVLHVAEADQNPELDEEERSVQIMADPEELQSALEEARVSEVSARQSVVRVCSMYGARLNLTAKAEAEAPKRKAARAAATLSSLGGNDMVLLKLVQAQQRSEALLAGLAETMAELQAQVAADHVSVVNSISTANVQLESDIHELKRKTVAEPVGPIFLKADGTETEAGLGQNIGKGIDHLGKGIKETTVPIGKALGIDTLGKSITKIFDGKGAPDPNYYK